jgi:hypothetical protein
VENLVEVTMPWKRKHFALGDAAFWIIAAISTMFAIPTGGASLVGTCAFLGAGVAQTSYSLQPE